MNVSKVRAIGHTVEAHSVSLMRSEKRFVKIIYNIEGYQVVPRSGVA